MTTPARKTTTARKQPQDRRPKRVDDDQPIGDPGTPERAHLEVTIDGETYRSTLPVTEAVSFGLTRLYGDNDLMFCVKLVEALFEDQPRVLDAIDEMRGDDMRAIVRDVFLAIEEEQDASLGESSRS